MARLLVRMAALVAFLVVMTALPATAQSRWENDAPVVLGLAQGGYLITLASPTFTGCTEGVTFVSLAGMPNLELWSVVLVLDEGAPLLPFRWVFTPFGTLNILWQSDVLLRVFPLASAQDLVDFQAAPCAFYSTRGFVAEGLGRMNYHSADDSLNGPGVNSWGWTIQGDLNDHGYCPAGSPRLSWLQRWVVRSQTDILTAKSTSSRGPTLTCR